MAPKRPSLWLQHQGIHISHHTTRHILDRDGLLNQRRRPLYPAHWAWDEDQPFAFFQVDVKDILDKQALGTRLWRLFRRLHLPCYQFTFCDACIRLHFLLLAEQFNRTNGLAAIISCFFGFGLIGKLVRYPLGRKQFNGRVDM